MRTRFNNKWQKTRANNSIKKIKNSVLQYPLLHAFGVGLSQFRCIPEANRSKAIDYARYMLAFELDDEIDSAVAFLKLLGAVKISREDNFVRSDYLLEMYGYWRRQNPKYERDMPIGVFAVAALILDSHVRIYDELKPHFMIPVMLEKRKRAEQYLRVTEGFEPWSEERMTLKMIE